MFHHSKTKTVQGAQLLRMVGQDLYVADAELAQDLSADAVQTQVGTQIRLFPGFVPAGVAGVGFDFICQSRPAPFLAQVDQDAAV